MATHSTKSKTKLNSTTSTVTTPSTTSYFKNTSKINKTNLPLNNTKNHVTTALSTNKLATKSNNSLLLNKTHLVPKNDNKLKLNHSPKLNLNHENNSYTNTFQSLVHYGDNIGAKVVKCLINESLYETQSLINQDYDIYQVN